MTALIEHFLPMGLQSKEAIADALARCGFGYMKFVPPSGLVESVMKGWREFLTLPMEERIPWGCGDPADLDVGYVPREPGQSCPGCNGCKTPSSYQGMPHDSKDFFHFKSHLTSLLDYKHVKYDREMEWLDSLNELHEFCKSAFHEVLLELNSYFPELCLSERFHSHVAWPRHTLRLLSYHGTMKPGQPLGKAHVDRNFGTIQVYESHPALVLNLPGGKVNYVPRKNEALMFTGDKAAQVTGKRLSAIDHVIAVPDDFVPAAVEETRQSIVFFGHIYPEVR